MVEVDTGCLIISDPLRLGEILENELPSGEEAGLTGEFIGKTGRPFAIQATTGFGDGKFPVFAEIMSDPEFGDCVVALHIHLYPEYSLPRDEKEIEEMEAEYLKNVNS